MDAAALEASVAHGRPSALYFDVHFHRQKHEHVAQRTPRGSGFISFRTDVGTQAEVAACPPSPDAAPGGRDLFSEALQLLNL